MRRLYVTLLTACALAGLPAGAQESFDAFRERMNKDFDNFAATKNKEFADFRDKLNREYADFVEKNWEAFDMLQGKPRPKDEEPRPPVIYPDEDKGKPIEDKQKTIEEVIPVVRPKPQPQPVVPIEEDTKPRPVEQYFAFKFFNTDLKVRLDEGARFKLASCDERDIARAWKMLSGQQYNSVINDCLRLRSEHKLCDWAYLLMLDELSKQFLGAGTNEAVLFTGFIYCQSGYKMRLASAGDKLYLLYASDYLIYEKNYWNVDGEKFYALDCDRSQIYICGASFPQEKALSLQVATEQALASAPTRQRKLHSTGGVDVVVSTNDNLMKFYDAYPTSMVGDDFGTRWAMYANTPLSSRARDMLYPVLKKSVDGKTPSAAAGILLNFVQTAFVYEYDDKVWGHDRAFFPDETLYYPYCDCEDRSILFSRLVRDLLGLDVVLIYYPGHLATAVCFPDAVQGDYILIGGKRYTICDPTYIGAPVGATMPGMNNVSAKAILLD